MIFAYRVLAHQMEEENYAIEVLEMELDVGMLKSDDEDKFIPMHRLRYELFVRMNYRALVSRKCCEDVTKSKTVTCE